MGIARKYTCRAGFLPAGQVWKPALLTNFFTALVYVVAIGRVVSNLDNLWNVLAYCSGVAVGTLVGMAWEQRMALGFAEVRFISAQKSDALADALRQAGFGVTEFYGHGRERAVGIVEAFVPRKNVGAVLDIAEAVDPKSVATVTDARLVQRGYWDPARR
ncbi:MAG TPA: DUF2179 domain-containing protein [Chloroflexi bacterium]|nr:DUF2179 domain-containing protein [Chloroflexota bacterium]